MSDELTGMRTMSHDVHGRGELSHALTVVKLPRGQRAVTDGTEIIS